MASCELCESALDEHAERLSALQNVVGLGITPLADKGSGATELGVAVYVSKKVPKDQLKRGQVIPKYVQLKHGGKNLRVYTRVIEQGEVSLESVEGGVISKESL